MKAIVQLFLACAMAIQARAQTTNSGAITGRVLGPDGKPVAAGLPISVLFAATKRHVPVMTTDGGQYEAKGLEEGKWFVQAADSSHRFIGRRGIIVRSGQVTSNVDLRIGSLTLRGTVKDATGKPLEGSFVSAKRLDFAPDEFLPTVANISGTVGADGAFALAELLPGTYSVTVAGLGRGIMSFTNYVLSGDATLNVSFQDSCRISGTVYDEGGKPLPSVNIQVFRVDPAPGIRSYALTGADGDYTALSLGPGRYEVIAIGPARQVGVLQNVAVESGTTSTNNNLTLRKGGGIINGLVTYGDQPLPVVVFARSASNALELLTRADERGEYTFDLLPDGDYLVNFSDPTSPDVRVTVSGGNKITLDHEYYGN